MDELTRAGISIPGEISIMGYDDSPLSSLARIDLTTVRQDSAQLARKALEFTVTRLEDGGAEACDILIEPQLVVRERPGVRGSGSEPPDAIASMESNRRFSS